MDKPSLFQDTMSIFLEGLSPAQLIAGFIMAYIGIAISLLIEALTRDPLNTRTPITFSWNFLWCDNARRLYQSAALTALVVFVSLRFADRFIGEKFSMFYALTVGLGLDQVILKWKAYKKSFGKNKPTP